MSVGTTFFDSAAADYVTLRGVRLPAPAVLTSPPVRVSKWDQRGGVGLLGAWPFYNGYDLMEFTLQFQMWSPETIDAFDVYADPFGPEQLFAVSFKRKNGKIIGVNPVDIVFPPVNQMGVRAAVVKSISAITHQGAGHYTCDVAFLEFNPPPPVKVSKRSDGPVDDKKNIAPKNADQTQIELLLKEKDVAEAKEARLDAQ